MPHDPLDGARIAFILSAGRTGTTFLNTVLPPLLDGVAVQQEPPGSRRLFMIANAWPGAGPDGLPARWYARSCRRRHGALAPGTRLVEVNPFLVPVAHHLPALVTPLNAVHMVRHPLSWIRSMAAFKAYGWRRRLIEHVPFALTRHPAVGARWHTLDEPDRWAWRWRLAAENNAAACAAAERTALVRYEDLFSADRSARQGALDALLDVVAPGHRIDVGRIAWGGAVNPAPRAGPEAQDQPPPWSDQTRRRIFDIVAPQARAFGYDEDVS